MIQKFEREQGLCWVGLGGAQRVRMHVVRSSDGVKPCMHESTRHAPTMHDTACAPLIAVQSYL